MTEHPRGTALCPKCKGKGYVGRRGAKRHSLDLRPQRIAWLRAHQDGWQDWKGKRKDWRARQLVEEMRAAGLIAQATYWRDVNLDALIEDAASDKPCPLGWKGELNAQAR